MFSIQRHDDDTLAITTTLGAERIASYTAAGMPRHRSCVELFRFTGLIWQVSFATAIDPAESMTALEVRESMVRFAKGVVTGSQTTFGVARESDRKTSSGRRDGMARRIAA